MKLQLEFIKKNRLPWLGLLCLSVIFVVSIHVFNTWQQLYLTQQELETQLAQLTLEHKKQLRLQAQSQKQNSPQEDVRLKEQQKILSSLNYTWNQVFATLEQSEEQGVAVLSFNFEQPGENAQIIVEALDTPAIVRYVNKLNDDNDNNHWYIATYQTQTQNMPTTVKATILNR